MASAGIVLEDNSWLSRADKAALRVEHFMALLSAFAVMCLILLAVISVGGRNFFNAPLPGYVDWIEQIMPFVAFLGISLLQRQGGHIRMDITIRLLRGRALWASELAMVCLMLAVMGLLVWGSYAHFARSFDITAPLWSRDSSIDISLPLWPAKLLVPIAFSVLCLRLVLQIIAYAYALITNAPRPVAVPLALDIKTQALQELENLQETKTQNDKP